MIDLFALVLAHGLLALTAWRLVLRDDIDANPAVVSRKKSPDSETAGDA